MKKQRFGPPRDVKKDKLVLEYRKKGLSFREIARLMGNDVKTVHTRHKIALASYPQGR